MPGDQRREAAHHPHRDRRPGAQIVIEAEAEIGVPPLIEAAQSAIAPRGDLRPLVVRRADDLRDGEQRVVRRDEDGAEPDRLDEKRVRPVGRRLVVARPLHHLDDPQVAVVLRHRRAHGRVGVLQVVPLIGRQIADRDVAIGASQRGELSAPLSHGW